MDFKTSLDISRLDASKFSVIDRPEKFIKYEIDSYYGSISLAYESTDDSEDPAKTETEIALSKSKLILRSRRLVKEKWEVYNKKITVLPLSLIEYLKEELTTHLLMVENESLKISKLWFNFITDGPKEVAAQSFENYFLDLCTPKNSSFLATPKAYNVIVGSYENGKLYSFHIDDKTKQGKLVYSSDDGKLELPYSEYSEKFGLVSINGEAAKDYIFKDVKKILDAEESNRKSKENMKRRSFRDDYPERDSSEFFLNEGNVKWEEQQSKRDIDDSFYH